MIHRHLFLHGLAAWNFQQASASANLLISDAALGEGWVPKDMLRDGAVVAKLVTGDLPAARQAFELLTPTLDSPRDLRSRVLAATLRAHTQR